MQLQVQVYTQSFSHHVYSKVEEEFPVYGQIGFLNKYNEFREFLSRDDVLALEAHDRLIDLEAHLWMYFKGHLHNIIVSLHDIMEKAEGISQKIRKELWTSKSLVHPSIQFPDA